MERREMTKRKRRGTSSSSRLKSRYIKRRRLLTVFRNVMLCNLVDDYLCFRGLHHLQLDDIPDYMASHSRRQQSS
jgi:hypothetical protein